jgi:hypothetical protein
MAMARKLTFQLSVVAHRVTKRLPLLIRQTGATGRPIKGAGSSAVV